MEKKISEIAIGNKYLHRLDVICRGFERLLRQSGINVYIKYDIHSQKDLNRTVFTLEIKNLND